jgi:hypothetical protein
MITLEITQVRREWYGNFSKLFLIKTVELSFCTLGKNDS